METKADIPTDTEDNSLIIHCVTDTDNSLTFVSLTLSAIWPNSNSVGLTHGHQIEQNEHKIRQIRHLIKINSLSQNNMSKTDLENFGQISISDQVCNRCRAWMSNLASKLGQIGRKWDKSGTF